jgi:3-dehydroquinate synthase
MENQNPAPNIISVDIDSHTNHNHSIWVGANIIISPTEHFIESMQHTLKPNICIITNETIKPLYLKKIETLLSKIKKDINKLINIIIPDGEEHKNQDQLNLIWSKLLENKIPRGSTTIISLGGGVITDIAGFAASTYKRGVDVIHIPTTLLAQIDASIGGKTAINHKLGKNMIGAFYQPKAIILDSYFLQTLSDKEFSSAMSEVIKYGLIWDENFYTWLISNQDKIKTKDAAALTYLINNCADIKTQVITQDPLETKGLRNFLNLGHTFGHAIENVFGYGAYTHGEAVGIGILLALEYSHKVFNNPDLQHIQTQVESFLTKFDLPISIKSKNKNNKDQLITSLIQSMLLDKKNTNNQINLVLISDLGEAVSHPEGPETLSEFLINSIHLN